MIYDSGLDVKSWFDPDLAAEEVVIPPVDEEIYPYVDGGYYPS